MLNKVLLSIAAAVLALLGLVGLVLPVLPGILLLAAAAGCLSLASPRFQAHLQRRLHAHPRYRAALRRWRAGAGLRGWQRIRLAFWLALASVAPRRTR